jgi:hypothetical protein
VADSYVNYTASGSTAQFAVTFNYLDKTHVKAYVDDVEDTTFTWPSDTTIQLSATPAANAIVRLVRTTPISSKLTTFTDGSTLLDTDMNQADLQLLYALQEKVGFDSDSSGWDVVDLRIENVGAPVANGDVATKLYVDTTIASELADFTLDQTQVEWEFVSRVADISVATNKRAAFTDLAANYDYKFVGRNWESSENGNPTHTQGLQILVSPSAGASPTWDETSADYKWFWSSWGSQLRQEDDQSSDSTEIQFESQVAPGAPFSFEVLVMDPAASGTKTKIHGNMWLNGMAGTDGTDDGGGNAILSAVRDAAQADLAVGFAFVTNPATTTTSGVVDMYRRKIDWSA